MSKKTNYDIVVEIQSEYIEEQSNTAHNKYAFSYTIIISNHGDIAAKLISRHWIITDGNGVKKEISGAGVVGEQPHIQPGEYFRYTSGAILNTPVGNMQGEYQMLADDGVNFEAIIPPFRLAIPDLVH